MKRHTVETLLVICKIKYCEEKSKKFLGLAVLAQDLIFIDKSGVNLSGVKISSDRRDRALAEYG